jgi:hypothetical protein
VGGRLRVLAANARLREMTAPKTGHPARSFHLESA